MDFDSVICTAGVGYVRSVNESAAISISMSAF